MNPIDQVGSMAVACDRAGLLHCATVFGPVLVWQHWAKRGGPHVLLWGVVSGDCGVLVLWDDPAGFGMAEAIGDCLKADLTP